MSAHTEGPWVWEGTPGSSSLRSAHGDVLGYAAYEGMWPGIFDPETDAANMYLIATAPALLEALLAYRKWHGEKEGCDLDPLVRCRLCNQADEVLAKVEGR